MYVLMDNDEWKQAVECHKWSPLHYRVRFKREGPWDIFPNEMIKMKAPERDKPDEMREYFGPVKIKAGKFQLDGIVIGHDKDKYVVQKDNGDVKSYQKGRLIFLDDQSPEELKKGDAVLVSDESVKEDG
jgi:hypothetical protein